MFVPIAFLGGLELTVVLVIVVLLFGNRIPSMARSLGQGIVEFRKGIKGESDADQKKLDTDSPESQDSPEKKN